MRRGTINYPILGEVVRSWEGWVELHPRGRDTHTTGLSAQKTMTMVNMTRNGTLTLVVAPLMSQDQHGLFSGDWLPRLF